VTHPISNYQTANTMRSLELLTEAARSAPELAEHLLIRARTARRIMQRLALDGYSERVPQDPIRQRYRIAERGSALGVQLAHAEQAAEPYRFKPGRR
jgi:DNA-binding IclR family transcriptional regulator